MPALPRRSILAALVLLLAVGTGCARVYFSAVNAGVATPEAAGLAYGPGPRHRVDVYLPADADGPAPVVVFFYGGRWKNGQRADYRFVGEALAERGMLVVIPDYRTWPEVGFPGFMEDAAAAVAWTHTHAREHGGDPARLFLAGHSAGAHIAALLATDPRYLAAEGLDREAIAGVVGLAGPYDFLPTRDRDLIAIFGSDPETQAESQPVNFVDADAPPFLLVHGDADRLVILRNSRRMAARLEEAGVPVALEVLPGVGHIRLLTGLRSEAMAPVLGTITDFITSSGASSD